MKFTCKILALLLLTSQAATAHADTIWEDYSIELNGGGTIYAVLEDNRGCFNLLVGSSNTNISGNASNCSRKIKGGWSISACGERSTLSNHGLKDVLNKIIKMCG